MPLGIWQLLVDRADEIGKAERCERHAGDVVLFRQRLEALPVKDGESQRSEVLGEPVRAGVVGGRTLGEYQRDQDFFRQCADNLRLDRLETLIAGPDAV